jgi:UPF0176 protein
MYTVILYYNFHPVSDPKTFRQEHCELCKELELKGRVYVSEEGINGTLAGTTEHINQYKKALRSIPGFENTQFKEDESDDIPFAKLIVKTRREIVALKAEAEIDPAHTPGKHISPEEWRKVMEDQDDYILIDVRNNYESKIGHFEGAIQPDLKYFYDFPEWLEDKSAEWDKDKKVLMYCTGGIRCEKFSLLMEKQGFEDVNQLDGGILNYAKEEGGKHFKGKCFVFDDRLVVPVNEEDMEPIAYCEITGKPADTYINCANMDCNKLFVCSEEGAQVYDGCCSEECMNSERKRPFNAENAFAPFRKWYHYFGPEFKVNQEQKSKTENA